MNFMSEILSGGFAVPGKKSGPGQSFGGENLEPGDPEDVNLLKCPDDMRHFTSFIISGILHIPDYSHLTRPVDSAIFAFVYQPR